jgi:hypothetical protein
MMIADLPPNPPAYVVAYAPNSERRQERGKNRKPQLKFVEVEGVIEKILPEDTRGLPHQVFLFHTHSTNKNIPVLLEVNHDVHFGERVPDLKVGEALTIKGVLYHDRRKDGIHWTHHRNKPGDAGFIRTPDGHMYQ